MTKIPFQKVCWSILLLWLTANSLFGAPIQVIAQAVKTGSISDRLAFSGEVKPLIEQIISPDISGRVEKVLVENGQRVKAGEVLVLIEKDRFLINRRQTEADLRMAEQRLKEMQKDFERKKILMEKKVLNDRAFEEAETAVVNAQATVQRIQAVLDLDKLNLERAALKAPINGIFVNRQVNPGQAVAPGAVVGMVIDVTKVYIEAKIPEHQINQIEVGQECILKDGTSGKVAHINPYGDESRGFLVKILAANPELMLKAKMFVKGDLLLRQFTDVPLLPLSALLTDENGKNLVYLSQNGKARKCPVQVLARDGSIGYARELQPGDAVVIVGQHQLSDGADILSAEAGQTDKKE